MSNDRKTAISAAIGALAQHIEAMSLDMTRFTCAKIAIDPDASDAELTPQLMVLASALDRAATDAEAYAHALEVAAEDVRKLLPEAN